MNSPAPGHATMAPAIADVLERQYAYFIYRNLECVSHLVTGISREPDAFNRTSRLYARMIHLLTRHGGSLPSIDDVLAATEGLTALLFHCSVCHREAYWPVLAAANERCFGMIRDRVLARGGQDDFVALVTAFDRALREYAESPGAEHVADTFLLNQAMTQMAEWADLLLREAERASVAGEVG